MRLIHKRGLFVKDETDIWWTSISPFPFNCHLLRDFKREQFFFSLLIYSCLLSFRYSKLSRFCILRFIFEIFSTFSRHFFRDQTLSRLDTFEISFFDICFFGIFIFGLLFRSRYFSAFYTFGVLHFGIFFFEIYLSTFCLSVFGQQFINVCKTLFYEKENIEIQSFMVVFKSEDEQ